MSTPTYTIVFSGQIRRPQAIYSLLDYINSSKWSGCRFIISTWDSEYAKHQSLLKKARENKVEIIVCSEPNLIGAGHVVHQQLAIANALSLTEKFDPVLKTRLDFFDDQIIDSFVSHDFPLLQTDDKFSVFTSKLMILENFQWHPFYINDIHFAGLSLDMEKLVACPLIFFYMYPNLVAEHSFFLHSFVLRSRILDIAMKTYVGPNFSDPKQAKNAVLDRLNNPFWLSSYVVYFMFLIRNFIYFGNHSPNINSSHDVTDDDFIWGSALLETRFHKESHEPLMRSLKFLDNLKMYDGKNSSLSFLSSKLRAAENGLFNLNETPFSAQYIEQTLNLCELENKLNTLLNRKDSGVYHKRAFDHWKLSEPTDAIHALQDEILSLRRYIQNLPNNIIS